LLDKKDNNDKFRENSNSMMMHSKEIKEIKSIQIDNTPFQAKKLKENIYSNLKRREITP